MKLTSDLAVFAEAVVSQKSGVFFDVCETPMWLRVAFGFASADPIEPWRNVRLSSETANAKIRKHAQIKTLGNMVEIIETSLVQSTIEARSSDRPNSIEVYVAIYEALWLVVYKTTANDEIMVASVYRVSPRNLIKARCRDLIFGVQLEIDKVDGRS